MALVYAGWMNSNELRNYPLHDSATKRSADDAILPDNILADMNIMVPESAGRFVYVSSVMLTPGLVSLTFLATDYDPLAPEPSSSSSSSSSVGMIPLAAITVQKPVVLYKNYPIEALYPGVAGWVAFGSGVNEISSASFRFVEPLDGLLASKAVRAYKDYPVQSLGKTERLATLTGLILLRGEGDVVVGSAVRTINGLKREVIAIGLDIATLPENMLRKYAGDCGERPEDQTCAKGKPFLTVNGVIPDCDGNIDIIFEGLDVTQVRVDHGMVIDLPIGLDDVCSTFDPERYDPADLCEEPSSSSSSSSAQSSLSSSSSAPTPPTPPAPTEYYDDFSDPVRTLGDETHIGALRQIQGSWYIDNVAASEAIVGRSRLHTTLLDAPSIIIHPEIYRRAAESYWTFSVIRSFSEDANGHVIFGYRGSDDFWYAGLSIKTLDAPYGYLYVGHKTGDLGSELDNWPRGLEYGYQFDAAGDPDIDASDVVVPNDKLYGCTAPNGMLYEWDDVGNVWVQVAPKPGAETITYSLAVYNGKLYGCTSPNGKLYRWNDVDAWVEVAPKLGLETQIRSLAVYNGKLYGCTAPNGKLYEWNDLDAWVQVASKLGAETTIYDLAVYNDKLYGCTAPNGKLYRWNDVNAWVQVAPKLGLESTIISLAVYDGKLYGGTNPNGKLYRWNDVNAWVEVAPRLGTESSTFSLAVYNGKLYGGMAQNGKLYKWNDVNAWIEVAPKPGVETHIYSLAVFDGKLYGSTTPNGKLYRWNDVNAWVEVAPKLGTETAIIDLAAYNNVLTVPVIPGSVLGIDARVEVAVSPVPGTSALHLVQVKWFWNRSGQGVVNPPEPFNTVEFVTGFNLDGYCGMGAVACETHFDNFGIFDLP
jgi:hypothetical protein